MLTAVSLQCGWKRGAESLGNLYFLLKKITGTFHMYEIAFVIKNIVLFGT